MTINFAQLSLRYTHALSPVSGISQVKEEEALKCVAEEVNGLKRCTERVAMLGLAASSNSTEAQA